MTQARKTAGGGDFEVAKWVDVLGGFITRHRPLWIRFGNFETRVLADKLEAVDVEQPIYVSGLARSGTTILLEALSRHAHIATHRYKDYPPVFTPFFWNWFLDRMPEKPAQASERAHKDGILVSPESPEAFEEVIWMAFFAQAHDAAASAVLDGQTHRPDFETFYRDHIRKLLHVRGARRYLCKGNYNLTRLEYLLKLFPQARFVIPIREPSWHIASLMKQHALFCRAETDHPRALAHMQRVGHFEFGLDRRPTNAGDREAVDAVQTCWESGREAEGWARYWAHVYGFVADRLDANPRLRAASLVVRFEDLCRSPREILTSTFDHCRLPDADALVERFAAGVHFPSYYDRRFSDDDLAAIARYAGPTAQRFGYEPEAASAAEQ